MLRFGPAGYPDGSRGPSDAVRRVAAMGLDAMEVQFVRQVRMSKAKANEARDVAREVGVALSCHAPYYVNLNSDDPAIRERSIGRVLAAAEAAFELGASPVVVHAATYCGRPPQEATEAVVEGMSAVRDAMRSSSRAVTIGLETMGKLGAWGTLDEIVEVMDRVDGTMPVVDLAHVHARGQGCLRSRGDFDAVLDAYRDAWGGRMHFHVSCVEYTARGERRHLGIEARDPDYDGFVDALSPRGLDATMILETPSRCEDAMWLRDRFIQRRTGRPHSD